MAHCYKHHLLLHSIVADPLIYKHGAVCMQVRICVSYLPIISTLFLVCNLYPIQSGY